MHDLSKQQGILPPTLAGGLESRGIEFVRDQDVGEILAGRLQASIGIEVT